MFVFNIDRGGTFTDFYIEEINENELISREDSFKVPSSSVDGEGPIVGIKKFLISNQMMSTPE